MKKCSECGEENELENKICQNCGATLTNIKPHPKNKPLIMETPFSGRGNETKKGKDQKATWNQSQWDKDLDYQELLDNDARVENVELDLSGEEDEQETPTQIEKNDLTLQSGDYPGEEIILENPVEASEEESHYQPQEEAWTPEPMIEYAQKHIPSQEDPPQEREVKKVELEAMLKKEMEPTHISKGIAHYDKNCIRFAGCVKLTPGQELKIGEHDYILKPIERKKFPYVYVGILTLAVLVVAIFQLTSSKKVKDSGQIIGMVYDQSSRMPLANALIQIKQLGKKIKSERSGLFKLDLIPAGSHDLEVSLAGFNTDTNYTLVSKKTDSYLLVGLNPQVTKQLSTAVDKKAEAGATKAAETVTSQTQHGKITLKTNIAEAIVLVDNKMMGKGSEVRAEIPAGLHTIRIAAEGYQDWVKNVRIQAGKTLDLEATLSETEHPRQVSAADYVQAGEEASSQGDYQKALENYTKAIVINSKNGKTYLERGLVYQKLAENKKATDDLTAAAKLFLDARDYDQAVKCYDLLLEISPDDPDLYYYRGLCYMKTEQYEKSVEDFKKTTQTNPKFFWGYMQLSYAYYRTGKYEESLKNAEKAKKINPHDRKVYVRLAESYLALGNKSKTKESYDRFIELTTLVDREDMKDDLEWKKVLQALNISDQTEF